MADGIEPDGKYRIALPELFPRKYKPGVRPGRKAGYKPHQNQLRALKRTGVPEGAVLNPYGKLGFTFRAKYRATYFKREVKPAYREKAMKRNRVLMKAKQARALEAHEMQQIARENSAMAMATLVEISQNKRAPEANRIAASQVILDRAYGKASQTSITANVTNGKTSDITADELDKRVSQTLKRVEAITNRAPKAGPSKKRPINLREYN